MAWAIRPSGDVMGRTQANWSAMSPLETEDLGLDDANGVERGPAKVWVAFDRRRTATEHAAVVPASADGEADMGAHRVMNRSVSLALGSLQPHAELTPTLDGHLRDEGLSILEVAGYSEEAPEADRPVSSFLEGSLELVSRAPALEELFGASENLFGADLEAYRNHAYRVLNFALALSRPSPDSRSKFEIACYFHDLGIWSDSTFDYIGPSVRRAREYLDLSGHSPWADEIARMISEHHKVTAVRPLGALVEAFRKADWTDVSLGILRFGLPRSFVREVRRAFPNRGFHRRLVELTLGRVRRHPFSPLPMFKW